MRPRSSPYKADPDDTSWSAAGTAVRARGCRCGRVPGEASWPPRIGKPAVFAHMPPAPKAAKFGGHVVVLLCWCDLAVETYNQATTEVARLTRNNDGRTTLADKGDTGIFCVYPMRCTALMRPSVLVGRVPSHRNSACTLAKHNSKLFPWAWK